MAKTPADASLIQIGIYDADDLEHAVDLHDAQTYAEKIGWRIEEQVDLGVFLAAVPAPVARQLERRGYIERKVRITGQRTLTVTAEMP